LTAAVQVSVGILPICSDRSLATMSIWLAMIC